jgi:hypothetical protein
MKRILFLVSLCAVLFLPKSHAQVQMKVPKVDSASLFVFLAPNFTYNFVGGDLHKNYGNNFAIGMDLAVKFKSNWSIDFGFKYYFGGNVKDDFFYETFKNLMTDDGYFIQSNGQATTEIADGVEFRGVSFHWQAGKIIPVTKKYRNSGIWIKAGLGVTQHFMFIKNSEDNVPSLQSNKNYNYKRGYDKLTIGFSLYQFIGYAHMNRRNLFCMYGGIELFESFSKRQRDFDYSLMRKDDSKFFDAMLGIKIGWIIPLYRHNPDAVFYLK